MNCVRYSNGMESNLMNGMCGIRPGFALSGLIDLLMTFARGVAPGWFVVAPSGRHCTGLGSKSARLMLGLLLFVVSSSSFAAESRLADAAEKSDRTTVRALLKRHADVNAPQADGMTALHWAVYRDDVKTAKLLVAAGANVKAENRYGVTALSMACVNGNTEQVELLLGAGDRKSVV